MDETALHWAAENREEELVYVLLVNGEDVKMKDCEAIGIRNLPS